MNPFPPQYWDLRTPNAIATAQLAERCYSMDTNWPYVVVATAERKIQVFDLSQNPSNAILVSDQSEWQPCFPLLPFASSMRRQWRVL